MLDRSFWWRVVGLPVVLEIVKLARHLAPGSRPARLELLAIDVVPAVLQCRALPDAAAALLAPPTARALRREYFRRFVPQA